MLGSLCLFLQLNTNATENMSDTYFTADLHLDHADILFHASERSKRWLRPGDRSEGRWQISPDEIQDRVDKMNEEIVERWNSTICSRRDTIYIIGDFAFRNHNRWISQLRGKKILIVGNHDQMSAEALRNFTKVYSFGMDRKISGQDITMCHYPMMTWESRSRKGWMLHGHVHGRMRWSLPGRDARKGLILDMGVDVWDFMPVSFDQVREEMAVKQEELNKRNRKY